MLKLLNLPAPAKINWFLHVTGRRPDGYHLLQSVFQCIDWADEIDLHLRDDRKIERLTNVPHIPEEQDLVVRAARLLQRYSGCRWGVNIAVRKRIPMGGGLGGGSSDAATVLRGLNQLWQLGLSRLELQQIGLELGADVPFFIVGETAFVEGVGEQLRPVHLPRRSLLLLDPGVSVPTAAIFQAPELTRNTPAITIGDFSTVVERGYPEESFSGFRNDLQAVTEGRVEKVREALTWLRQIPEARHARMSGSGGCCFALWQGTTLPVPPSGMQVRQVCTLETHPLGTQI